MLYICIIKYICIKYEKVINFRMKDSRQGKVRNNKSSEAWSGWERNRRTREENRQRREKREERMVYEERSMEDKEWRMEYAVWSMKNGEWKMENGEWSLEKEEWKMHCPESKKDDKQGVGNSHPVKISTWKKWKRFWPGMCDKSPNFSSENIRIDFTTRLSLKKRRRKSGGRGRGEEKEEGEGRGRMRKDVGIAVGGPWALASSEYWFWRPPGSVMCTVMGNIFIYDLYPADFQKGLRWLTC